LPAVPQSRQVVSASTAVALESWAARKRLLLLTPAQPLPRMLSRLRDEDPRVHQQHCPEVFNDDALAVQIMVAALAETLRLSLTFFHVLRPLHVSVAEQAQGIGIDQRRFWECLATAELCIDVTLGLRSWLRSRAPLNGARISLSK